MTASLDLTVLPIVQTVEQDQPSLPGLHVASPPRRSARGRDRDHLVLYLSLSGNAPLGIDQIYELLSKLTTTYYKTPGSVTTAQRAVAESLNEFLLNRNLRSASSGQQLVGLFTQAVLRESRIYISQSGPVHAYLIGSGESRYLYDPQLSGRGLGLSRTTTVRFSQAELKPNDAIIIAPQLPTNWTIASVKIAHRQGPENLKRCLLNEIGPNMKAALIQTLPGDGQIRKLRPVKSPSLSPKPIHHIQADQPEPKPSKYQTPSPDPSIAAAAAATVASSQKPDYHKHSSAKPEILITPPPYQGTTQETLNQVSATSTQDNARSQGVQDEDRATSHREQPPIVTPTSTKTSEAKRAVAAGSLQFINWLTNLGKKVLPDESIFSIPPGTMAIIAIAVPILVVILASMVYFQRGRTAQYEIYFLQATEHAQYAETLTDPNEQRIAWETTIAYLDRAEAYQSTSDTENLRASALNLLDNLNVVERLGFKPALTRSLNEGSRITRIVAIDNDLYLLNAVEGIVLRATLSNKGYILDQTFQCGPGPYEGYIVGAIVDIAALPTVDDSNATVLGIDANSNLLYCAPGISPVAGTLTQDTLEWGPPKRITINMGDLYVLDPQSNAVWIYRGMDVSIQPQRFFNGQNPSLEYAIDLAVNNNTLYVLHADSHITTCEYSPMVGSPTRCEDPATFIDPREGLEDGALVYGAYFNEILFLPPPDPSIYLLDPFSQAVYHYSVQLAYQRQFRSQNQIPNDPASSFTINRGNLTIFIAIGNQVYYANLP
ncbi:MAG: hypothetical protein MUO67_19600 [Anaerolineales bacterium]|nr:hypothetical protein [Anaerolineales bacterium]